FSPFPYTTLFRSNNAVGRLVTVTCYSDHDRLAFGNAPLLYKFPANCKRGAGSRLGKDPFGFRKKVYRLEDLLVCGGLSPASAGSHTLQNIGSIGRVPDRDGFGD